MPHDVVFIPDNQPREEAGATEQRHRFRKKDVPAKFVLRLMCGGEPQADLSYSINVAGDWQSGSTDGNGYLSISIPPDARRAQLLIGEDPDEIELSFGHMDPCSEVSGAQARLVNMGFYTGEIHGTMDDATCDALRTFQRAHELDETGDLDQETQDKLRDVYGS
jgi:N-acetylmuramoyl-L-alanine amidase